MSNPSDSETAGLVSLREPLRVGWNLPALVTSLRARQCTKNGFVFAALVFSGNLWSGQLAARAAVTFLIFCALSSSVYLLNDVLDSASDRRHPLKRHRPVASGSLAPATALGACAVLALVSLASAMALDPLVFGAATAYALVMLAYCCALKRVVLLDAVCVSFGFVLRAAAGAIAIGVWISYWLVLCTALLSLFLALGKRRHEMLCLGDIAPEHRPVLAQYSMRGVNALMLVSAAGCLVSYALYAVSSITAAEHPWLIASLPFVVVGVGRYLWHVYHHQTGGSPDDIVLRDFWFAANGVLWLGAVLVALAN
jgi:4-hydroxybenzoate polyprenyltransferase